MKPLFTLAIAALLFSIAVQAQQSSRLIGIHTAYGNSGVFVPYDTGRLVYNAPRSTDPRAYNNFLEKYGCDTNYIYGYSSGQYYLGGRMLLTFDGQDFVTSVISQGASGTPLAYENAMQRLYTYDATHNETEELWQDWQPGSSSWVNENRKSAVYTAGNKMQQMEESWNTTTNTWKSESQYDYTYTPSNKVAVAIYKFWNNTANALVNSSRTTYTYNAANNVTEYAVESWNATSSTWGPSYKELYTLNAAGNRTYTVAQNWDVAASNWINGSRILTAYNSTGLAETDTFEQWNTANSVFDPSLIYLHNYDANGNELQFTLLEYNDDSLRYINREQITTTYNTYDQPLTYQSLGWDLAANQWAITNGRDIRYHYQLYTADVGSAQAAMPMISLFPVPARNEVTLKMNWTKPEDFVVALFDIQGRMVKQWGEKATTSYSHTLSVADMPSGNYFMTIRSRSGSTSAQMSVVH